MSTSIADLAVNISTNVASLNDGMAKAADAVNSAANRMSESFLSFNSAIETVAGSLTKLAGLMGIGFGVGAFVSMISGAIEGQVELGKLAEKTGATVESLSAMRTAAKYAGVGMDEVGSALIRFSTSIIAAQKGTGKQADALTALGFDAKTFATSFSSTDQALMAVVNTLDQYSKGIGKAGIETALLGRGGAQLAVFYNELAKRGLDNVTVTDAQAKAAKALEDSLTKLQLSFKGLINALATQLVPVLQKVVDGMDTFKKIALEAIAVFVVLPAAIAAVTFAVNALIAPIIAYREAVIGAALANELLGASTTPLGVLFGNLGGSMAAFFKKGFAAVITGIGGLIFAGLAGWQFGTWLEENFFEAKVAGAYFVDWMLTAWENVKYAAQVAWASIEFAFSQAVENMKVSFGNFIVLVGKGFSYVPALAGMSDAVVAFGQSLQTTAGNAVGAYNAKLADLGAANTKAKASIHAITDDMKLYAVQVGLLGKATDDLAKGQAPIPDPTKAKKGANEIAAEISAINSIAALQKQADADAITQAKDQAAALLAINKNMLDSRQIDTVQFAQNVTVVDQISSDAIIASMNDEVAVAADAYAKIADLMSAPGKAGEVATRAAEKALLDYNKAVTALGKAEDDASTKHQTNINAEIVAQNKVTDALQKEIDSYGGFLESLQKEDDLRAFNTSLIGKSTDAILLLNAAHAEGLKITDEDYALQVKLFDAELKGDQQMIDLITSQLVAVNGLRDGRIAAAQQSAMADKVAQDSFATGWQNAINSYEKGLTGASQAQTAFNSLTSSMETLFVNMANHATNAFQTFKNSVLQAIEQIVAKMATSGIMQLLGFTGGASGVGGIASLSSGNLFSGVGSWLSGLLGGGAGGITDALGVSGDAMTALYGGATTAATGLAGLVSSAALAAGASEALAAGLAAAVPVVGWFAAAGILAYSLFSSPGGGPKVGGSASVGDVSAISGLGTGNAGAGRFFTPNAGDATLAQTLQGLQATYAAALASLGGKGTAGFALGYDTDPLGTAASRVSAGVAVGGKQVFQQQNLNVGRTDAELQTALALEAQRVVLAALKASDLPADIAKLFSSIDVPTATSAQITAIEQVAATYQAVNRAIIGLPADTGAKLIGMLDGTQATATAVLSLASVIQAFGSVVSGLGPQISALDPASLTAFVAALGGAATMATSFSYLATNFTTTAQKLNLATDTLNTDFTNLGITAIPQTHQAFLDLLASFDLTTDAGRSMYASVLGLSSLFVTVHGTADQAAGSVNNLATATAALTTATTFFQTNFYSAAEQAAAKTASELKQIADASSALGVSIPTSVAGFRALIEGIDQSTDAGKKLYAALIVLGPAVFDLSGAATAAAAGVNALAAAASNLAANPYVIAANSIQTTVDTFMSQIATLAGQMASADVGGQLALQIKLVGQKILALKDQSAAAANAGDLYSVGRIFDPEIALLDQQNNQLAAKLADFTVLTAQYGSAMATQLLALKDWYATQQTALAGNAQALGALTGVFNDKWAAIIAGTSAGVSSTIGALQKIADYLKSLQISTLSPLTPMQQLSTASTSFEADYTKAKAGDATALGNITTDAGAYLALARAAYASSQTYTDIFNRVTKELADLAGTTVTGQPHPVVVDSFPTSFAGALPANGAKLASSADIAALQASINDALAAHANAGTADTGTVTTAVARGAQLIVGAVNPGLK